MYWGKYVLKQFKKQNFWKNMKNEAVLIYAKTKDYFYQQMNLPRLKKKKKKSQYQKVQIIVFRAL